MFTLFGLWLCDWNCRTHQQQQQQQKTPPHECVYKLTNCAQNRRKTLNISSNPAVEMELWSAPSRRPADLVSVASFGWLLMVLICSVCLKSQWVLGESEGESTSNKSTTNWMAATTNLTLRVAAPLPTTQNHCSISQLLDATPIRGWCCDCWNSTFPEVSMGYRQRSLVTPYPLCIFIRVSGYNCQTHLIRIRIYYLLTLYALSMSENHNQWVNSHYKY